MRTVMISHLKCSPPKKCSLFGKTIVQDYDTNNGIVREFSHPNRMPKYKLMKTREPINVEFI